jgi:hypothetical protein
MPQPVMLLLAVVLVFSAQTAAASDVAVVVDVSGSMKDYGPWQGDAKVAIAAVLGGRPPSAEWDVTPKGADLSAYATQTQESVTLIQFGSVRATSTYPYFDRIQTSLSPSSVSAQFPINPSTYTESRTNNALAEAVAISMVGATGGPTRVIMLSDFLADARMSEEQLAFVNGVQGRYAKYTDATLSWIGNPRVQIKLLRFAPLSVASSTPVAGSELGSLHLFPPRYDEASRSVIFSWNYEGPSLAEKYDVKVVDVQAGSPVFTKYNLGSKTVTYPKVSPGRFRWSIVAYAHDGKTIEQSASFVIPGKSPIPLMILCIAIIAGLGVGIIVVKKHGFPDLFARFRRRVDTDV